MKKSLLFIALCLTSVTFFGQLKAIKATKQSWTGGIPGFKGNYYNILFSYKAKDSIVIDSFYVNGIGFAAQLSNTDMGHPHYYKTTENNQKVLKLFFKESYYPCTLPDFGTDTIKQEKTVIPTRIFKGEALLIYHKNGKKKKLIIKKFEALEPINYP